MWFYDDEKTKLSEDGMDDHDGFPDVISDAVCAICSAAICCAVAVVTWAFKNGIAQ